MYYDVIMAGFGGQGIQIISQIVAVAAIKKGLSVTYLPSYGVEKRGGRTNVTLVVSDGEIGSMVTNTPVSIIAMDTIALEKYQPMVSPGGLVIANTSLIATELLSRGDIDNLPIPCNEEAIAMGSPKVANMIALGAFIARAHFLEYADVEGVMQEVVPDRLKKTIPGNLAAIRRGMEIAANGKR
jgi:2-oxoglutarate ferredoxin oxidoreductase subunit gamma